MYFSRNYSFILNCTLSNWAFIDSTQGIEGVNKIKDGYNPSTWMLEVTSTMQEQITGINFSEVYKNSELHRYVHVHLISKGQNTNMFINSSESIYILFQKGKILICNPILELIF